jgi:hypothetical protein
MGFDEAKQPGLLRRADYGVHIFKLITKQAAIDNDPGQKRPARHTPSIN